MKNQQQQQQKVAQVSYDLFLRSSNFDQSIKAVVDSAAKYKLGGLQELANLSQILIFRRKLELDKAEKLLRQSIAIALQHNEKVFLYHFYLSQAYVQTDIGNSLNAVYHYRLARKVAEELNNADLFTVTDIGISDIYTNIGLYPQALIYLEQAQQTYNQKKLTRMSLQVLIYINKAEIYYKMGQLDSLSHYIKQAEEAKSDMPDMKWYITRFRYFELILQNKYDLPFRSFKRS